MSVGGGKSSSEGGNTSQSYIAPSQRGYLKNLWGTASDQILNQGVGAADMWGQQQSMNMLQNNPFQSALAQFSDPNNALVQQQLGTLSSGLQQQFSRDLLPAISTSAINSGALGGGRQGVAQGLGMQGIQDAYMRGATGIMSNAYGQAQQAAQFGADWATRAGMAGMQGLGMAQQQQFAPLMALAQILGNPTVLQRGGGYDSSSSQDMKFGFV